MLYKTIVSGRLDFGSIKSYERIVKMYEQRSETYYRSDIFIKMEDIFPETEEVVTSIVLPRFITQASDKTCRNTIGILEFIAQYAVAGEVNIWVVDEGKIKLHKIVEPQSDKSAVQAFMKARDLLKEGKDTEAIKELDTAIEKYESHALAYERRGFINFKLANYDDAVYDFSKSIRINPTKAEAYYGRAIVNFLKEDLQAAIEDFQNAIKKSIPLQPIFWNARRIKGECHLRLDEPAKAVFELKFFTKRQFAPTDSNYAWRKKGFYNFGLALAQLEEFTDAIAAFDGALGIDAESKGNVSTADILLNKGKALKKAGKTGFNKCWKEAAALGSEEASTLLKTPKKNKKIMT